MDFDTARKGMDMVFNNPRDTSIKGLHFFGGEPLLNWDLMQEADAYYEEHWGGGVTRKSVTTNGTLLTPERSQWLADHGYYIGLSLDGGQASHDRNRSFAGGQGSFEAILKNAHYMIDKKINFKTIIVVSPENLGRLPDDVVFLYQEGFRAISLNLNTAAAWNWYTLYRLKKAYSRISRFYVQQKRAGRPIYINVLDGKLSVLKNGGYAVGDKCQMGVKEVSLSPSGHFYPCERFVGNDDDPTVQIGSLSTGLDPRRVQAFQQPRQMPECRECQYQPYCVNWCGCSNFTSTGIWDEVSGVQCRYEQILINMAKELIS